ncbi:YceI family protein [Mucilaginibacter rubeus]|uniref:YceI family protein n=1 Tax=Mucilaginibacter rubeus TaxID=2027860 RepID=A0AAE6JKG7_9SPHI|nr:MULTISPECIES: YceI family protein [Mucilaginibacter]QEM06976.1 YceI family protein [Mucilaginibacter rubeus]QEM19564.1 YceI family protein [Mucilaginibacter gossypii]QTE43882.1 YceI family protein [Mucilaginibacter rubeus]QTE50483.1 YceI family protein [Mucilaginibacter rubeus]QTE55568.1 YceI family protein [Mucilaginibacter rubeus]
MNKKIYIVVLLIFATAAGFAQTVSKSDISFKIKNLGFNVGGTFGGLQADIKFKPNDLEGSSIEASVLSNTVNTDNESRDKHLKSEDYFDVIKYPKITLKSVSFKRKSGSNYIGNFNVTIRDKTKLIEVPFTYTESGNTAQLKGSFMILRTDFGIGGKNLILSNEANVSVEAEISK